MQSYRQSITVTVLGVVILYRSAPRSHGTLEAKAYNASCRTNLNLPFVWRSLALSRINLWNFMNVVIFNYLELEKLGDIAKWHTYIYSFYHFWCSVKTRTNRTVNNRAYVQQQLIDCKSIMVLFKGLFRSAFDMVLPSLFQMMIWIRHQLKAKSHENFSRASTHFIKLQFASLSFSFERYHLSLRRLSAAKTLHGSGPYLFSSSSFRIRHMIYIGKISSSTNEVSGEMFGHNLEHNIGPA
jgi:hypothetical protein